MNLAALALKAHVPMRIKRRKLNALFEGTAQAFNAPMPEIDRRSFERCLEQYALFTKQEVERRLQEGGDLPKVRDALYILAHSLGKELREELHLRSRKDVLSVGKALYRAIGIEFDGTAEGTVVIRSCFFSRFYSEAVCRVMSSLDEGIAAGLSAGGKLKFSQRITDGKPCCRAFFDFTGAEE